MHIEGHALHKWMQIEGDALQMPYRCPTQVPFDHNGAHQKSYQLCSKVQNLQFRIFIILKTPECPPTPKNLRLETSPEFVAYKLAYKLDKLNRSDHFKGFETISPFQI